MSRTDFSGIFGIVVEIRRLQHPVFITDQTVSINILWVKFHLQFHVFGNGHKCRSHFLHQHLLCLKQRIDVSVVAVSAVRKPLHIVVLDISRAKSQNGEIYAAVAFFLNKLLQLIRFGNTDIQVTVCRKNNTIISALYKISLR